MPQASEWTLKIRTVLKAKADRFAFPLNRNNSLSIRRIKFRFLKLSSTFIFSGKVSEHTNLNWRKGNKTTKEHRRQLIS